MEWYSNFNKINKTKRKWKIVCVSEEGREREREQQMDNNSY